jgi:uncharacterized protein (UPF0332 family)
LKDDNLVWCLKQKRGIRIIEPNPNLTKAYLKKATSALNTMTAALKINEADWIAATAYYARYFALYALLMRMGVKSEIHDCTLHLARLLAENGILSSALVEDICQSKQTRIDTQYYVEQEQSVQEIKRNVEAARRFVLATEEAIENLTAENVNSVRMQLQRLKQASP